MIIASFISVLKCEKWWVRSADFPRVQIFVLGIITFSFGLFLLDLSLPITWIFLSLLTIALLYQLWWIIPFTVFYRKESKQIDVTRPGYTLTILTANVLTPNRHADKLIALVQQHQPDVLVTLESDAWWQQQLRELDSEYAYRVSCPLDNLYGMHLYSKLPLSESEIQFLVEEDIPSMHTLLTLRSGKEIRMHFLHPAPPSPTENEASTERDAELIMIAKSASKAKMPIIVTGDLNDVAWSTTTRLFRKISGLLDPRVGRGMFNTFHADHWYMRWPLDHLFHSKHFKLFKLERMPSIGSDHFPLLTTLVYDEPDNDEHLGLEADHEDKQEAEEKMASENVTANQVPTPS